MNSFVEYDTSGTKNLGFLTRNTYEFGKKGEGVDNSQDEEKEEEENEEVGEGGEKKADSNKKLYTLNNFSFPFFFKIVMQENVSVLSGAFKKKELSTDKVIGHFYRCCENFFSLIELIKMKRKVGSRSIILSTLKNSKIFFEIVSKNLTFFKENFETSTPHIKSSFSRHLFLIIFILFLFISIYFYIYFYFYFYLFLFYFIYFYFILFIFILFYLFLFYFILFYFILFIFIYFYFF